MTAPTDAPLAANPIDRLALAVGLLQPADPDLANWLAMAIDAHVRDGESLDRALGLAGSLGRSPRFEILRRERNHHLTLALTQLGGDYARLADEVARFELRLWPTWRYRTERDPMWSPARGAVFEAFRVGVPVPGTVPGLRKALAEN